MTQHPDARSSAPASLGGLRVGTVLGGYRLLRRLGAGGMGVVWEAEDDGGRHVAMKILHPQIAADPLARRRLDREASVLARVRDPRVARILDIETGDGPEGSGVTFVITELIDGPTLQHEVDHEGAYDLSTDAQDLADLAHGLVGSLKAVHAAGVIHRDLKPSNVMLGAQGPVLIDFGIAQVADDLRLTQTGQVTGTPGFIPPEMLDGEGPTPQVDWYACAGVLLFAVTGRAPFGTGPWQAVFRRVYAGTPETGSLQEDCPALARAFCAALAPSVDDRLPVEDLLLVLDDLARGGDGEEVVDDLLGDAAADLDEADTDTGTFNLPYGITPPVTDLPEGSYGAASAQGGAGGPAAWPSWGPGHDSGTVGQEQGPSLVPPSFLPVTGEASTALPEVPDYQPAQRPEGWSGAGPVAAYAPAAQGGTRTGPASVAWGAQPSGGYAVSGHVAPAQTGYGAGVPQPVSQPQGSTGFPRAVPTPGLLPQWAREPRRHRAVVAAVGLLLTAVGAWAPVWMMIAGTVLVVVAGTVGRADDARRWRRLQQGGLTRGDTSRMWAATPWYLLRSLVATAFAVLLSGSVVLALIYFGSGLVSGGSTSGELVSTYHRMGEFMAFLCAVYLWMTWFVPWGAPSRRGGARVIETLLPTRSARTVLLLLLLLVVLCVAVAFAFVVLPPATLSPYSSGA